MPLTPVTWAAAAVALSCVALPGLSAADWSQWRGPNRNGISAEAGVLTPWSGTSLAVRWRAQVGTGFSSIAVNRGRLYTLGNRSNIDTVCCLEAATGRLLWQHSYPCLLDPNLYEGGPSATPTVDVDAGVVYTLSKWGDLFCLVETNGSIVWQRQLARDFGLNLPFWGVGSSPLLLGQRLLLNAGGRGLALDKSTGQLLWLSDTNQNGYGTPVPYDAGGTQAVVFLSHRELVATAVPTGSVLWTTRWQTLFDMNCPDVLVHAGKFFVTSYQRPATLLEFRNGRLTTNWQTAQLSTHLSSGVVMSNHLYSFHGDAERSSTAAFKCLDLQNGAIRWASNGLAAGSVIAVADQLLVLTGDGQLLMVQPSASAFRPQARASILSGRCWTPPAFSGGTLFARNADGDLVAVPLPFTALAPPQVGIERQGPNQILISWPANATGFRLESATHPSSGSAWSEITNLPATVGERKVLTRETVDPAQYYRLTKRSNAE